MLIHFPVNMNDFLRNLIQAAFVCFCLWQCQQPAAHNTPLPAVDPEISALEKWLENEENGKDTLYFQKIYDLLDVRIKAGNYPAAADVLISSGRALDKLYSADKNFHHVLISFLTNHADKLSDRQISQLNYYAGVEYLVFPPPDSAIYFLGKVKAASDDKEDLRIEGLAKSMLSFSYLTQKQLDSANTSGLAALRIFEKINDTINIGKAYQNLLLVNSNMNAKTTAQYYLNKRAEWAKMSRDTAVILLSSTEYFYFFIQNGDTAQAIANGLQIKRMLDVWKPTSKSVAFTAHNTYARTLIAQGNIKDAKSEIDAMEALFDGHETPSVVMSFSLTKGWYELNTTGKVEDTRTLLDFSERYKKLKNFRLLNEIYSVLTKDAANRGNINDAYHYKLDQITYRDSLWNNELRGKISELSVQYETREKETKIASLNRENKLANQRNWWIGLLSFAFLLLTVYYFRYRGKKQQELLQKENEVAKAQALYLAQVNETQRIELESHKSQLEDYAQMLIQRNDWVAAYAEPSSAPQNTDAGKPENAASKLYNATILTEEDWQKFKGYYDKVYPGVITNLRIQYPEMTQSEIRLILLGKMGLSIKECASIMGVSIDAVKKGRYRLKKKYEMLNDEENGLNTDQQPD